MARFFSRFWLSFFTLLAIFVSIHILSVEFALYWSLWWLDDLMHLAAGAIIVSFVLGFFAHRFQKTPEVQAGEEKARNIKNTRGSRVIFFWAIFAALAIGLVWEASEFAAVFFDTGLYAAAFGVWSIEETVKDLALDGLGGILAAGIFWVQAWRESRRSAD